MRRSLTTIAATFTLATLALAPSAPALAMPGIDEALPTGIVGDEAQTRIVDGQLATQDPGIVAVLWAYKKNGVPTQHVFCTGSVVAPQWILTAKHCMGEQQKPAMERISFRVNSLNAYNGGQDIKPETIDLKPTSWEFQHDMMLVRLKEPIANPKIVKLADADPPLKSVNTIYGFGSQAYKDDKTTSPDLKTAEVLVHQLDSTDYERGPAILSSAQTGGSSHGDSGGPQFYQGAQVGVSSLGARGTQMYSSVAKSRAWIDSVIKRG